MQKYHGQHVVTFLLDGHDYVYSRINTRQIKSGAYSQWRCILKRSNSCRATCSTLNDNFRKFVHEHNHGPTFSEKSYSFVHQNF